MGVPVEVDSKLAAGLRISGKDRLGHRPRDRHRPRNRLRHRLRVERMTGLGLGLGLDRVLETSPRAGFEPVRVRVRVRVRVIHSGRRATLSMDSREVGSRRLCHEL